MVEKLHLPRSQTTRISSSDFSQASSGALIHYAISLYSLQPKVKIKCNYIPKLYLYMPTCMSKMLQQQKELQEITAVAVNECLYLCTHFKNFFKRTWLGVSCIHLVHFLKSVDSLVTMSILSVSLTCFFLTKWQELCFSILSCLFTSQFLILLTSQFISGYHKLVHFE